MNTISAKLSELGYRPLVGSDHFPPLTEEKLSEKISYPLPDDYLQFLAEFPNTGMFEEDVVCSGIEGSPVAPHRCYLVGLLFASCSDPYHDLLHIRQIQLESATDPLPGNFGLNWLSIGDEDFGDAYLLELGKGPQSKVYYWDHEHSPKVTGLYLVANSFAEFIERLRKSEE